MMPRPRRKIVSAAMRDRWLLSYADFITLLFAFFTTLYAISTVDTAKLSHVAQGLHQAFDTDTLTKDVQPARHEGVLPQNKGIVGPGRDVRPELMQALADDLRVGQIELSQDHRGLVLSIPEAGSFPVGSADLSPVAETVMHRLAAALGKLSNAIRVEGHTDDVPIHTPRFASNWDLSTARATRVVEFLIEQGGLTPDRLSAAGYGEYHPRVANDSPDARARNRRVDIIILSEATRASEEPVTQSLPQ